MANRYGHKRPILSAYCFTKTEVAQAILTFVTGDKARALLKAAGMVPSDGVVRTARARVTGIPTTGNPGVDHNIRARAKRMARCTRLRAILRSYEWMQRQAKAHRQAAAA